MKISKRGFWVGKNTTSKKGCAYTGNSFFICLFLLSQSTGIDNLHEVLGTAVDGEVVDGGSL